MCEKVHHFFPPICVQFELRRLILSEKNTYIYIFFFLKSNYHASRFKNTRENLPSILKYLKAWIYVIVKKYIFFICTLHDTWATRLPQLGTPDAVEWSVSRLGRCTSAEGHPCTHWKRICLGPRAGPDNLRRKCPLTPARKRTIFLFFQFHGSVHHISVNENTNLMQQSQVFYFT